MVQLIFLFYQILNLHNNDCDIYVYVFQMMLGLVTHEPHMSLLREEVRFGGKKDRQKRSNAAEDTTFHLLHLSLMREYIDFEFKELKVLTEK